MLDVPALEATLGFKVLDVAKYESVFTHKTATRITGRACYERLEFMGDAVLGFVVTKYLFDRFPDEQEGFLTRLRTKLVSGDALADLARRLRLDRFLVMSDRAMQRGYQHNKRILEDVLESLIGAVYLDLGLVTAKTFVLGLLETHVDWDAVVRDTNYKDILIRYTQAASIPMPEFRVLDDPAVTRSDAYVVAVAVRGAEGLGRAPVKKLAEQLAARETLRMLGVADDGRRRRCP